MSLHYSHSNLTELAENGLTPDLLASEQAWLQAAHASITNQKKEGKLGFAKLPYADISEIQLLAEEVAKECKNLVVVGIGGSDLGTRAIHRALNHQYYNSVSEAQNGRPRLFFIGDTTDPEPLLELCDIVDWAETVIVMVSKSGNTIEQMSTFLVVRQYVLEAVGAEKLKDRIITITDPSDGTLHDMSVQEGYRSLAVPKDVGGRFSVLTPVGLFPLAVVGVDITAILAGARDIEENGSEVAAEFAYHQFLAFSKLKRGITIMMPYTYALRELGFWFRQLWAESLGKRVNKQGEVVQTGPQPIAAIGPTDQHSQVQLYMEGPHDKIVTFVTVTNPEHDITVPAAFPELEGASYLAGIPLSRILLEEQKATASALAAAGRPSVHLEIDTLDAFHIGSLIYFFELATAYGGELWDVDAYNQPGVELGKQLLYKALGREGY